jgi:cytoskeletal protein CcmA (bactofilin family)
LEKNAVTQNGGVTMFKKDGRGETGITLVATNCELVGDVHFSDQLLVNGIVKGNIYAQSGSKATITVSEKGRVRGEIHVPNVIINGKVFGDIRSDKHVELAAKAEVKGDVYYHLIEMVKGSRVDGHLVHLQDGKQEVVDPLSAKAADSLSPKAADSLPPKAADKSKDEASVATVAAVKSKSA